ncbi:MAG TPA: glycosyltransferase [Ignavibacteria bacterium]
MKKVLIITYHFPPEGRGLVLRPLKFAKYFLKHDWQPIILTSTPKTSYFKDDSLLDEANMLNVQVFRTKGPAKNLLTGRKLAHIPNESRRRLKRNWKRLRTIPDEQESWIKKAVKLGTEIIENNKIEIIYATAPPFSALVAAGELKEKFGIPLVIDYQDSWIHSPNAFFPLGYHKLRNMKLEQEVIRVTDEVITVNRRIKEYLIEEYHYLKHEDINIIHHGFDEEDLKLARQGEMPEKNRMRLTHSGSLFDLMSPEYFFEALTIVFNKKPELRSKIEACFLGGLSREHLDMIKKYNLSDVIFNPGYVDHITSLKYMLGSDVLWFMINNADGDQVVSPVRLCEYMGTRKPILACVPDGAAKQILKGYDAVRICEPDQPRQIANLIIEYNELYEKRMIPAANEEVVKKFDVEQLTAQLVRYFEFLRYIPPEFDIRGKEMIRTSINSQGL